MTRKDDPLPGAGPHPADGPPEIGDAEIDRQHRVLLRRWSDVIAAGARDEPRRTGARLWFIEQYTQEHFATEERLMAESSYLESERHQKRHRQFAARLARLRQDVVAGRHAVTSADWEWVVDWFERHIQEEDLRLKRHLDARRRAAGPASPAPAAAARGR